MLSTQPLSEEQSQRLWNDDLENWLGVNNDYNVLDAWVQKNILHAVEHCPKVVDTWLATVAQTRAVVKLAKAVATALEDVLSDDEKCAVLSGERHDKTSMAVYNNFQSQAMRRWRAISPAWVGPENSALREKAVELGWTPEILMFQIPESLYTNASKKWFAWVPFPYSIAAIGQELGNRLHAQHGMALAPAQEHVSMPNANPLDVALAQHISQACASPRGGDAQYKLTAHPDVAPLAPEDHLRLKTLAQLYLGLDALEDLRRAACLGHLPLGQQGMDVGLPDLGLRA